MIEDKDIAAAQLVGFSPYAKFMNATKGLYYKDMETGERLSRFKVWLREHHDDFSIKRVVMHLHSKYVSYDKEGWKDGHIVDRDKVGIVIDKRIVNA